MQERKQKKENTFPSAELAEFVKRAIKVHERLKDRLSARTFKELHETKVYVVDEMLELANAVSELLAEADALNLPDFYSQLKNCRNYVKQITANYQDRLVRCQYMRAPYE